MRSNDKVKSIRKSTKKPTKKPTKKSASGIVATKVDTYGIEDEAGYTDPRGILTLKYEVDDRGIGQLLLPPSLSLLLQSDRVSISPSAGGLFIRSV
jgi:hypothetical protein